MTKNSKTMIRSFAALSLTAFLLVTGCGAPTNNATSGTGGTNTTSTATASNNASQTNSTGASNGGASNNVGSSPEAAHTKSMHWTSPPPMQIDKSKQYDAVFHTNYGDFTVQLFAKDSPVTVNNFVFLAKQGFYKNDAFFRIIQSFMIQTGDPLNNGTGGPGYQFNDELPPKVPYAPGIVAMANAGPNTNGSQFFICTGAESEGLSPNYTEFGKVTSGMDVVQKIAAIPVTANPQTGEPSYPTQKAYIESIDIQVH